MHMLCKDLALGAHAYKVKKIQILFELAIQSMSNQLRNIFYSLQCCTNFSSQGGNVARVFLLLCSEIRK